MRCVPFGVMAVIAALGSSPAYAATSPPVIALHYDAVSGCPDVGIFRATVVGRLGYEAFADSAPASVLVRVTSTGQSFEGRMEWRDREGNWAGDRTFPAKSSDCEDLVRAMAFALALRLQLSAIASSPEDTTPATAETEQTVRPPAAPPTRPAQKSPTAEPSIRSSPEAQPGARPTLLFGAGTLLGFNRSSSVVPFGRIFGGIAWPHWSLVLGAEAGLPATIRRSDGAGFSHQQLLVTAAVCGNREPWTACLLAKGGQVRVSGRDIEAPASESGPLLETGLRVGASQRILGRVHVAAYAEALVLPVLWSVRLDDSVVWTSPRWAETLGLELAYRFE